VFNANRIGVGCPGVLGEIVFGDHLGDLAVLVDDVVRRIAVLAAMPVLDRGGGSAYQGVNNDMSDVGPAADLQRAAATRYPAEGRWNYLLD